MGGEWPLSRLDSLTELIVDCPHSTPNWRDNGEVVLRNQNIRGGRLDLSSPSYTDHEGYLSRIKRATPQAEDLVLTREAPMGEVCMIPNGLRCCMGQRMVLIRTKRDILSPHYLLYLIQSPFLQHQISWNEGTGTTVSNIRIPNIKAFNIPVPPLLEQKAIAHILGTLDDKIELNRQINATLEAMAQALFKSWFVDFDPVIDNAIKAGNPIPDELAHRAELRRKVLAEQPSNTQQRSTEYPNTPDLNTLFPDAFQVTEELGWIPQGWEVIRLSELITLIGGGTPKTSVEAYWNGNIPWFSVVDAPNDSDVFVIDTEKKISAEGLKNSSTKRLRSGTTIISARGTVGRCALVGVEMTMNQSCYGIQGAQGISDSYTYYSIRNYVADLQQRGHGSVFNTITRDTFQAIRVPFGGVELSYSFEEQVTDLLARVKANLFEQITLTKLRDTLLPKLISGELSVATAQAKVEEAASGRAFAE